MKRFVLKNGMVVLIKQRPTNSVAIELTVKVGSNYEHDKIRGLSHFLEHMLFEGTNNRSARQIANEIESIGGEINAFTDNERTSYYVVVLHKYFDRALDVISDIIQNPVFDEKIIDKERKVVLDEINLTTDDPKIHQWVLFQKLLYKKHNCRYPVYGTVDAVSGLKRKDFLEFYSKYYVPNNMILSIVGNIDERVLPKIEKAFMLIPKPVRKRKMIIEPKQVKSLSLVEKRKLMHSYIVLGYKSVPRSHPDSFVFDVIRSVLGRGQSSKLFQEIRTKRGLAYSVGAHYEANVDYGWIAIYVGTDKKNLPKIRKIVLEEVQHLKKLSQEDLEDAINFLEGDYLLSNEDNHTMADTMSVWDIMGNLDMVDEYVKNVKEVSQADVKRVVNKYFKHPVFIVIKQI
ncbi:insulinase family protein [Candidatus Woesearchaeota archaeon]|nr:insulinase family protein [Candidatus Woesearchaeota archaeon]